MSSINNPVSQWHSRYTFPALVFLLGYQTLSLVLSINSVDDIVAYEWKNGPYRLQKSSICPADRDSQSCSSKGAHVRVMARCTLGVNMPLRIRHGGRYIHA